MKQTRSDFMGVACAVNHFQRRKKLCIASKVTEVSVLYLYVFIQEQLTV